MTIFCCLLKATNFCLALQPASKSLFELWMYCSSFKKKKVKKEIFIALDKKRERKKREIKIDTIYFMHFPGEKFIGAH